MEVQFIEKNPDHPLLIEILLQRPYNYDLDCLSAQASNLPKKVSLRGSL